MPGLAHERVAGDGRPGRWIWVLHGIYGAGRNWGSVARRLVRARPDWGALLIDLRQHGASQGFDAPHTLGAAARDLAELAGEADPPAAVLGHSFGGKVALRFAADGPPGLGQVWVIDSTPEAREPGGSAWEMLEVLRSLPGSFESRTAGVDALAAAGVARPIAQWMSTNLTEKDGRQVWRIDLDDMEAMLRDFFATDLWPVVESPPPGITVHLVRASESSVLSGAALERAQTAAADSDRVVLHEVEGGHWLNADNPERLVALLSETL